MSKIEQALREWAENYNLAAINDRGRFDAIVAIDFLAHKILHTEPEPDDPEPAPWTFGDLKVGDWFEDEDGDVYEKTGPDGAVYNARRQDGERCISFEPSCPVHPFEWEWV